MIFRRIVASMIDVILMVGIAFAPNILASIWLPAYMDAPAGQPPTPLMGAGFLWAAIVLFCYFPSFESSAIQATPGKFLMRLKVTRPDGGRISFVQGLYRMVFGPFAIWYLPSYRSRFSGGALVTTR